MLRESLKANKRFDDFGSYLATIEAQAIALLTKAGLPTEGFHSRQPNGTWRSVTMEEIIKATPAKPGEGSPVSAARVIEEMGFEPD
ncbi:MAG: hypothetical protein ACLQF1_08975, partial [Methyloceanibacter sp.]